MFCTPHGVSPLLRVCSSSKPSQHDTQGKGGRVELVRVVGPQFSALHASPPVPTPMLMTVSPPTLHVSPFYLFLLPSLHPFMALCHIIAILISDDCVLCSSSPLTKVSSLCLHASSEVVGDDALVKITCQCLLLKILLHGKSLQS